MHVDADQETNSSTETRDKQRKSTRSSTWVIFMSLAHGFAVVLTVWLYLNVVPRLTAIWADFDVELPVISRWLVQIGQLASNFWYLGLVFLLVDFVLLLVLSLMPRPMRWLAHLWSVGVLLACVAMLAFLVVAGVIPTINLISELAR